MEIFVFNKELDQIGIITDFSSLIINDKYSNAGDFTLKVPICDESIELLKKNHTLLINNDTRPLLIRNMEFKDTGKESNITAKGFMYSNISSKRVVFENYRRLATYEKLIEDLWNRHLIKPADSKRKISNIAIIPPGNLSSVNYYLESSYKNLLEITSELCTLGELGFRTTFNPMISKMINLEIYKGKDRTVNQSKLSPVIFSKEYDLLLSQTYTLGDTNNKNMTFVAGEGEGAARQIVKINDQITGFDRDELFVDAKDLQQEELSNADYLKLLNDRGEKKVSEYSITNSFDAEVTNNNNLRYGRDWFLGDLVTVQSKLFNVVIHPRITEVQESYDKNGLRITPVFGESLPTIYDKLKQKMG